MKEMNEKLLRGWRPRPASAGLKSQIFQVQPDEAPAVRAWNWGNCAPVMACVLFIMMALHFNGGMSLRETHTVNYLNLAPGSNAAIFSDHAQEVENHLAGVSFAWTNRGGYQPGLRSHADFGPSTNLSN